MNGFLPISKQDMTERGWYYCDFLIVTATPMSTTPHSVRRSFPVYSRTQAIRSRSSVSRISAMSMIFSRWDGRAMRCSSTAAILTRWSRTIPPRKNAARTMPILPAARAANVPTAPSPSIPCSHAVPSPIRRSISAASRRACDALRTTTTGRTASCPPFWSLPARTV